MFREDLIADMKSVFGNDQKRIAHALMVLEYAENIKSIEEGDLDIVVAAAILHDIGIQAAERKYSSSAGNYQEIEGPPIAREILQKYDLSEDFIDHVCRIIANHHSAKDIDTPEFRIIWDADWLVNIPDEFPEMSSEEMESLVGKVFRTKTGKDIAFRELL